MTEEISVSVSGYTYSVKDAYGKVHTVGKDKSCSCGKEGGCWHVNAVKKYLNSGGAKAPDVPPLNTEHIEAMFTGNNYWHSRCTQSPYQSPYPLRYHAERIAKLKAGKTRMDADGDRSTLGAVGQYWYDLTHMNAMDVEAKWRLNEPEFPVASYVQYQNPIV